MRLIAELQASQGATAREIVTRVLSRVQAYSAGNQFDDLTLLVACAREAGA